MIIPLTPFPIYVYVSVKPYGFGPIPNGQHLNFNNCFILLDHSAEFNPKAKILKNLRVVFFGYLKIAKARHGIEDKEVEKFRGRTSAWWVPSTYRVNNLI